MIKASNDSFFNFILFIFIGIVLFFLRYDLLYFNSILNPDEGQFVAGAMRMSHFGINFDDVYGGSSGPFNSIILMWPIIFNLDINLATTRLSDLILVTISIYFIYLILRSFTNKFNSLFLLTPLIIFYGMPFNSDFSHYAGERLSTTLLIISFYLIIKGMHTKEYSIDFLIKMLICAFVLGVIPYSKIQVAPVAFGMGIFLIIVLSRTFSLVVYKNKLFGPIIFVALLPTIFFLSPLYLAGNFLDFYYSYVVVGTEYISDNLSFVEFILLSMLDIQYYDYFKFLLVGSIILTIYGLVTFSFKDNQNFKYVFFTFFVIILSYFVIITPGKLFPHYLIIIQPFILIFFSFLVIYNYEMIKKRNRDIVVYYKIIICAFILFLDFNLANHKKKYNSLELSNTLNYERNLFKWLNPTRDDTLLQWGWMCQLYIDTNLKSATREPIPYSQIYDVPKKDFFVNRYEKDFKENNPNFIIDAVSPGSYNFNNVETQSIKINGKINRIVEKDYTLLTKKEKEKTCPRIYIRNIKYEEVKKSNIEIENIFTKKDFNLTDINNLNDSSIFETCEDYWVLKDNVLDDIFFEFKSEEKLSTIFILNTRNGINLNKATKDIEISLLTINDKVVFNKTIQIEKYPQWTEIKFDKEILIKKVIFRIKSFYKKGAGLNEVKFIRK